MPGADKRPPKRARSQEDAPPIMIVLRRGHVLFFNGAVLHAGAAGEGVHNYRYFWYLPLRDEMASKAMPVAAKNFRCRVPE